MYSPTDFIYWLYLLGIFLSFVTAFYIPGRVILGKEKKLGKSIHVIAIVVGLVLWALQGYVFGLLQLRFLSYIYLLIFLLLFIKNRYYLISIKKPDLGKIDFPLVVLLIIGIVAQILPYFQVGVHTQEGMRFVSVNAIDHLWHAGLVQEIALRFPPNEPGMAGVILKDYHYWFNLCVAEIVRVFHLPVLLTQFAGFYTLASVLLGLLVVSISRRIYQSKIFTRLLVLFLFFVGDASGWVMVVLQNKLDFSLSSLINSGVKFVDSPGFSYSIIIGLTGFLLLLSYKKVMSRKMLFAVALIFASLLEFKVYTGITFMFGLMGYGLYSLWRRRYDRFFLFIIASILGALFFFPNISSESGLFFLPFETPRNFITQPVLGLLDWELRWRHYLEYSNHIRLFQYGLYMSGVYLVIQFGLQLVGLFPLKKLIKTLETPHIIFLYAIISSGIILSLFFYQTVGGANIWEFLLPVSVVLSIAAALNLTFILEKRRKFVQIILTLLIVVFILPRWIITVTEYVRVEYLSGFKGINEQELESYIFISNTVSDNEVILIVNQPHVSYSSKAKAVSGKQFYLSGEGVRQKDTPEILRRRSLVKEVEGSARTARNILMDEQIDYLYFYNPIAQDFIENSGLKLIFRNKSATIFSVK